MKTAPKANSMGGKKTTNKTTEYLPSPSARRVIPKIDEALKEKIGKAIKTREGASKRKVNI